MTISLQAWNKILDRAEINNENRKKENVERYLIEYFSGKYFATVETVADILGVNWEVAEDKIRTALVARSLMK